MPISIDSAEISWVLSLDQGVPDMNQQITSQPATSWDDCTNMCMNEPECESAIWDTALELCDLMRASTSTNDKTCSIDNVIGGRKCATERVIRKKMSDKSRIL